MACSSGPFAQSEAWVIYESCPGGPEVICLTLVGGPGEMWEVVAPGGCGTSGLHSGQMCGLFGWSVGTVISRELAACPRSGQVVSTGFEQALSPHQGHHRQAEAPSLSRSTERKKQLW